MPDYLTTDTELTSVANAIRTKGGTSSPLTYPAEFVSAIENIPTGGGGTVEALTVTENGTYTAPSGTAYSPVTVNVPSIDPDDLIYQDGDGNIVLSGSGETGKVIFIDYDGTELYRYYKSQVDDMESLPSNPTHTGLTAQGWNWTLAQIKSYLASYPEATIIVGQMYNTSDGKTRIYVNFDDPDNLSPYFCIKVQNGTTTINWGDNTEVYTIEGTSSFTGYTIQHTYGETGSYIITVTSDNSKIVFDSPQVNVPGFFRIQSTGAYADMASSVYSSKITRIEIGSNISLGSNVFQGCINCESISIPNDTTIVSGSNYIFNECTSLKTIVIPNSIIILLQYMFNNCYSLKYVSINSSVTDIFSYAFYNCYSLKKTTIPSSVTSISSYPFMYCRSLESIVVPNLLSSISNNLCNSCNSLKQVTISNNVTSIGNSAFAYCHNLRKIKIPSGVTAINASAFSSCYSLKEVVIPGSVTAIGGSAFTTCYSLEKVTMQSGVTTIGSSVFSNCYLIKEIVIPNTVISIGNSLFSNCSSLKSVDLPNSITSMGGAIFSGCYSLEFVNIPNSITIIKTNMFQTCYSLVSVDIPDSVTEIQANAFTACRSIKTITIPENVTTIGNYAFMSCCGMRECHLLPTTPPTLGTGVFSSVSNLLVIYVPYSADHSILTAYQNATNWSTYTSYMQEEPQS